MDLALVIVDVCFQKSRRGEIQMNDTKTLVDFWEFCPVWFQIILATIVSIIVIGTMLFFLGWF